MDRSGRDGNEMKGSGTVRQKREGMYRRGRDCIDAERNGRSGGSGMHGWGQGWEGRDWYGRNGRESCGADGIGLMGTRLAWIGTAEMGRRG